jgi:transposase
MNDQVYYVGMDVHKKTVAYCVKRANGTVVDRGSVRAMRRDLTAWLSTRDRPWVGVMEATIFTGWIHDFLAPHFLEIKVGNPLMMRAISQSKKKSDKLDAAKLADMLRADLVPECYMMPQHLRDLRRMLRYRNLMVREAVRMQNKAATLLMEVGAEYSKTRLHGKRYFHELLESIEDVPESVIEMLKMSRGAMEVFQSAQKKLVKSLREHPEICHRVELLMTIPGVGEVTALTWALEIGDRTRFGSIRKAVSYCGLCSAQKESAGKSLRGPISKQRNKHLQSVLIEASKLAPIANPRLAEVRERELAKGDRNRATLAVARKLVAYLMAVDVRQTAFEPASDVVGV